MPTTKLELYQNPYYLSWKFHLVCSFRIELHLNRKFCITYIIQKKRKEQNRWLLRTFEIFPINYIP